jgi:hypothetical protein
MVRYVPRDAASCPTGHQTLRSVSNLLSTMGKNSKKSAPSTGKLPPTPKPMQANRRAVKSHVGARATSIPKNPAMKRVELKAIFRPSVSLRMPQETLPKDSPKKVIMVVYRTSVVERPNSVDKDGRVSAKP